VPITFPSSPSNADEYTFNGRTYTYNAARGVWLGSRGGSSSAGGGGGGAALTVSDTAPTSASEGDLWFHSTLLETYVYYNSQWVLSNPSGGGGGSGASLTTSDTAPATPSAGDLWFNSTDLTTYVYYDDGSSSQWVSSMPSGVTAGSGGGSSGAGVTTYADITARDAVTPSQGDLAFVTSVTALYVYDGTEWDRIWSGADEYPTWTTELPTTTVLAKDGTPTTLTVLATDPEGFDMTYTYDTSPSNQTQVTSIVNNNDGTFTLTPSTNLADAGSFTFRAKATDGVSVIYTTTNTVLAFSEDITFSSTEPGITSDSTNSIVYSKNNGSSDSTSGGARSSVLQDGRYYFEVEITGGNAESLIGIARSTDVNIGYSNFGQPSIYTNSGNLYPGGTATGFGLFGLGDTLQIAYDNTTDEAWFNKNDGTWYPNDPSSGAGIAIGGTSGGTVVLSVTNGASAGSSLTADIKTAGTSFNYTVPTGFTGH
jgi:hypothetical protein